MLTRRLALLSAVCITLSQQALWAVTYQVGPTRANKTLGAVVPTLKAGDTVAIDPGTYRETARLTADGSLNAPITIRGVGAERPVFDAMGLDTSGRGPIPRGVFQIQGAYYRIEHLEFKNARNGENAAGIRLLHSTNVVIRDCKISQCDMGVFGDDRETAAIEGCDVCFNSTREHNGYAHNFYMAGNRVAVRYCVIHDCPFGQNFKSRAHFNVLAYNRIWGSNEGEVGIVDAKGDTDRPNSNSLLVGNTIISKAGRTGNTWKFVLFGSESGSTHNGTLYAYNNTFIAADPRIRFITLADPLAGATVQYNIFVGSRQIVWQMKPAVSCQGVGNWLPTNAVIPAGWTDTAAGPDPGFTDPAKGDYTLKSTSLMPRPGPGGLAYTDGDGARHTIRAGASSADAR